MLSKPIYKNNKYISKYTPNTVRFFISDVKVKSLHKFIDNKGYLMTIFIPNSINSEVIESLISMDKLSFDTIMKESKQWFDKDFELEELQALYKPTYCIQNHTMNIIISNNVLTNYKINDKELNDIENVIEIMKNLKYLKKCILNVDIQHNGLYFYKEEACHKWIVKSINITDTTTDKVTCVKEDVEDKMGENINNFIIKTREKISLYKSNIESLNTAMENAKVLFDEIKELSGKKWNEKINELNNLIMMQEDNIG